MIALLPAQGSAETRYLVEVVRADGGTVWLASSATRSWSSCPILQRDLSEHLGLTWRCNSGVYDGVDRYGVVTVWTQR